MLDFFFFFLKQSRLFSLNTSKSPVAYNQHFPLHKTLRSPNVTKGSTQWKLQWNWKISLTNTSPVLNQEKKQFILELLHHATHFQESSIRKRRKNNINSMWILTIAWRSTCGFQSESYRITTSAVAKLIPRPPARVLNMNTNFELPGSLYALIDAYINKRNISVEPNVLRVLFLLK